MSRLDDAASGLKALSTYHVTILDAHLNNHNAIADSEENQAAIKALRKHHLAWQLSPGEPVQLSRALLPTLAAVTRNYVLSSADFSVGHLWDEIVEAVENFREARKRGALTDADTFLHAAYDTGFQLIEGLRESLAHYSHHVSSGFSHIRDLELRARKNRQMIERARKFNDILASLDYSVLHQLAGSDQGLRKLLLKAIPQALEQCQKELSFAIHRLTDLLHTITHQQHQTKVIEAVARLYQSDQGYTLNLDDLDRVPPPLLRAPRMLEESRIDTRAADHEETLSALAQKVQRLHAQEVETHAAQPIADARYLEPIVQPPDPVEKAIAMTIMLVDESDTPISGLQIYRTLELACSADLWLLALTNAVYGLPEAQRRSIHLSFVEHQHPQYTGNYRVEDVMLNRTRSRA